jgi:1,4-dihydroxy-6-naphthoate synthase
LKLTLGFSPCPNDTFIFDALVNKKIDTGEFEFDSILEDVETLNQWALVGQLDITKLSFPAFFQSLDKYVLLNSGGALGKGAGPLLISKKNAHSSVNNIQQSTIAIPGVNTTANFLLSFAFPEARNKIFLRYDQIEDWILKTPSPLERGLGGEALGVIIHENRFTYQQNGLHKLIDLGEYWEQNTKLPIPLGAIAVKRKFERSVAEKLNNLIKKSLEYAFANYPVITDYVKQHSQEMSEEVMRQHIELYVNNYSLDLGDEGKQAIEVLYKIFTDQRPGSRNIASSSNMFIS